jgi:hypothetical protein
LHEFDGEAEKAASLIVDHLNIFLLSWAGETVSPVEVHSLTTMKVD